MTYNKETLENGNTLLTTSAGHKVEIRNHITARQALELRQLKTRSFDMEGTLDGGDIVPRAQFNHEASSDLEMKTLGLYIVSFNGDGVDALNKMLDGGTENCLNEVIEVVNEVTNSGKKDQSES